MNNFKEIIDSLSNCEIECERCAALCLEEENVKELSKCIKLNRDCADICSLGIKFLTRQSGLLQSVISVCADLCALCAEECEKHDHKHCERCAAVCRECEELCKQYLDSARQMAMNA